MSFLEALMKAVWGTDTEAAMGRAKGDRMVAEAERKVDRLNATLDERPPRNLDEALYEMTHRGRE